MYRLSSLLLLQLEDLADLSRCFKFSELFMKQYIKWQRSCLIIKLLDSLINNQGRWSLHCYMNFPFSLVAYILLVLNSELRWQLKNKEYLERLFKSGHLSYINKKARFFLLRILRVKSL
jgi:hypothetical protein